MPKYKVFLKLIEEPRLVEADWYGPRGSAYVDFCRSSNGYNGIVVVFRVRAEQLASIEVLH